MYINPATMLANEMLLKQRSHPSKKNQTISYLIRNTKGIGRDSSHTSSHNKQANPNGRRQSETLRGQSENW